MAVGHLVEEERVGEQGSMGRWLLARESASFGKERMGQRPQQGVHRVHPPLPEPHPPAHLRKLVSEIAPPAQRDDKEHQPEAVECKRNGHVLLHDNPQRRTAQLQRGGALVHHCRCGGGDRRSLCGAGARGAQPPLGQPRGAAQHGRLGERGRQKRLQRARVRVERGDCKPVKVKERKTWQRTLARLNRRDVDDLTVHAELERKDERHDAQLPQRDDEVHERRKHRDARREADERRARGWRGLDAVTAAATVVVVVPVRSTMHSPAAQAHRR